MEQSTTQKNPLNSDTVLHQNGYPTNSVNKSFIALLITPNKFIEKIDPAQQTSSAEPSCELKSTLLIHGD